MQLFWVYCSDRSSLHGYNLQIYSAWAERCKITAICVYVWASAPKVVHHCASIENIYKSNINQGVHEILVSHWSYCCLTFTGEKSGVKHQTHNSMWSDPPQSCFREQKIKSNSTMCVWWNARACKAILIMEMLVCNQTLSLWSILYLKYEFENIKKYVLSYIIILISWHFT